MTLFSWDPAYSVGCAEIDEQHRQLFQLADDLHQAMMERRGKDALASLLKRLVAYTKYHFATEERRMKETGFPSFVQHQAEHQKLTQQVVDFQTQLLQGKATVTIDLLKFLSDWLRHHIQGSDQKLGAHLTHGRAA